jgi:hypothetical protein
LYVEGGEVKRIIGQEIPGIRGEYGTLDHGGEKYRRYRAFG